MKNRSSLDLTTGSVTKQLLLFALPLMFNHLINSFYSIADKMVLGLYVGDLAMAAAGATNAPFSLFYQLFSGFSIGVTVICGNLLGAKDKQGLRDCMYTALITGGALGFLVCALGLIFSRPILAVTGTPSELMTDALLYFRIRFCGTPVTMLDTFCYAIFLSRGDTRRITAMGMVSGLTNVVLNLAFVLLLDMGIAGVAIATVISQLVKCVWKLVIMFNPKGEYALRFSQLRMNWKLCGSILSVGIPNGLNNTVFTISNVLLQSTVNSFGSVVIAGNSAATSVADLVSVAYSGIPNATVAAVSQCHGAHDYGRIKAVIKKSLLTCEAIIAAFCLFAIVLRRQLLGLFTQTPAVIDAGVPKLMFYCGGYLIHTFGQIYIAGLKGLRRSSTAFVMNVLSVCVPRVLWVLFVVPLMPTPNMLYLIYPLSWLISAVLLGIAYHSSCRKVQQEQTSAA